MSKSQLDKATAPKMREDASVDKARAEKAVAAADAALKPLGFVLHLPKDKEFNMWGPGIWFLESPRMSAKLRLQEQPWNTTSPDKYVYRLELSADITYGLKNPRVAPGNAQAVKDYLAKIDAARRAQDEQKKVSAKLEDRVREIFVMDFPNLKVVDVDKYRPEGFVATVTASDGSAFRVYLDDELKFTSLRVIGENSAGKQAVLRVALRAL